MCVWSVDAFSLRLQQDCLLLLGEQLCFCFISGAPTGKCRPGSAVQGRSGSVVAGIPV